jgi:hypothetical protein
MAEQVKLTPSQRASYFAQLTRKNEHMVGKKTVTSGGQSVTFTLPKARLLSKIWIDVEVKLNIKHATLTTVPTDQFTIYKPVQRVGINLNNGFFPYTVSGRELAMYNLVGLNSSVVFPQTTNDRGANYIPTLVASSTGADNTFHCLLEMPITLNDRDMVGIVLLQNDATQVDLTVDIANGSDIIKGTGYTTEVKEVNITPMLDTFTIPSEPEAFPDLSVVKLVQSVGTSFVGSGQQLIKVNTGIIYRKMLLYIEDENGNPFDDTDITSTVDLVFNTADVNYSIAPKMLAHKTETELGIILPKGLYVFDFTYNGFSNYGGNRDYLDTEKLSQLDIRFTSSKGGKIYVITEGLARLQKQ